MVKISRPNISHFLPFPPVNLHRLQPVTPNPLLINSPSPKSPSPQVPTSRLKFRSRVCSSGVGGGLQPEAVGVKMSAVNITNVAVLDNPSAFLNPFQFEISYECLASLKDDLEWKLIYVGSAEDETYDQLLESVLVGPVNVGNYRFVFQADPPDPTKIRDEDIIGVTVLLLTCSYMGQEFVRVGYYVNNDYDDEQLREEPPQKLLIDRVQRNILADKPRVTKFPINFHPENSEHEEQAAPSLDDATEPKPPLSSPDIPPESKVNAEQTLPSAFGSVEN